MTDEELYALATELHCGIPLARDLMTWAGRNADLVREASSKCNSAESMKAYIIDKRVARIEETIR